MKTVIFGAQGIALGTYKAILATEPNTIISCFVVSSLKGNMTSLCGLEVVELRDFSESMVLSEKDETNILIATPQSVMDEIEDSLVAEGFLNITRIDSHYFAKLLREAFSGEDSQFKVLGEMKPGDVAPEIEVGKMVHRADRQLLRTAIDAEYVHPIQVGAAMTDERIAKYADDTMDNISVKNGDYSELTGLYWMWKNRVRTGAPSQGPAENKYFGLFHYRRRLMMDEDDLLRLVENDIDAVLPFPMPYEPDIEEHHKRYLSNMEWDAVLQAISELYPEDCEQYKKILLQGYMYNYNVIIAKGKVLDDYCTWLFSILFRVEEIVNSKGSRNPNRYMGYIGETLETLYFMYNKDKLKLAHTGCEFLI